jgi:hypothetical protein
MFQILYLIIFVVLTVLAVANLIRNMMMVANNHQSAPMPSQRPQVTPHPELLDSSGKLVNEPLMVMRSTSVEDIRSRLDAIYESSPGGSSTEEEG